MKAKKRPHALPVHLLGAPAMTSEQFLQIVREKGWTQEALASRWGFSSGRDIRRIARDIGRLPRYADAVVGLPYVIRI